MSEKREAARIVYEKTESGAVVGMRGTRNEIISALVRLIYTANTRIGLDIDGFAVLLPVLVEFEKETLDGTEFIDLAAIRKAKEGGA